MSRLDTHDEHSHLAAESRSSIEQLLQAVGEDVSRAGLKRTPQRVIKSLLEMTEGYTQDPAEILNTEFGLDDSLDSETVHLNYHGIVGLKQIQVLSLCEHHLLPFVGQAAIFYIPNGRNVVGVSKLSRLVSCFARRLQVQERLTDQVADALVEHLEPQATAVFIEAEHFCMRMRGVKQSSTMVTSALRGSFKEDQRARLEVMALYERS